jgi:signal transduction histidine kinase
MIEQIEELLATSKAFREKKDGEGLKCADEAYLLAQEAKNYKLAISALKERISFASDVNRDYQQAEKLCKELLDKIDPFEGPEETCTAYNVLGICHDIKGDYITARNYYLQTVEHLKPNLHPSYQSSVILGNAYYNIAKLYVQLNLADERIEYLERAREVFETIKYRDGLARVWNVKAAILPAEASVEERLQIFEKAYAYFENGKDEQSRATCAGNIGLCYCHLQQFEKGIAMLEQSAAIMRKHGNPAQTGFSLFQLAEGHRRKGDNRAAIALLDEAADIMLAAKANVYLGVLYSEWALNLAAVGDFKGAYEKQLLYNEQTSNRLKFDRHSAKEEARLKFELDKKEKESDLLRKKNEEIALYNEKLEQSNAELNQFAYVASHDLKEPLRMVSNYMQLLERTGKEQFNEDQLTYMRYANEGAKRMFDLINSLLSFSKSTIDVQLKQVDLNNIVEEVRRIVIAADQRNIQIDSDVLPVIKADASQMLQVFQNLVSNGIKYNNSAEVKITISYISQPLTHRFSIEDNGIGIAKEHRELVFDIFKRLHDRQKYSGTGIGLSICKKIVHRMNGRIWIEDGRLGGSAFVFTISKQPPVK